MSDISDQSILQSKENAKINNLDVEIIKSDMFNDINNKFDIIISNPPYIPKETLLGNEVLNHEPHIALFGGIDGNDFYKIIINNAKEYIKPNGMLILEISQDNSEYLRLEGFKILKDINEKDRIAIKRY